VVFRQNKLAACNINNYSDLDGFVARKNLKIFLNLIVFSLPWRLCEIC